MTEAEKLRVEIEQAAKALGKKPSTVGESAGQGGQFYKRLQAGKRVWPETAAAVRSKLADMLDQKACDISHSNDLPDTQGSSS